MMRISPADARIESTLQRESVCLIAAAVIHALALWWNPGILKSNWHPAHEFVTIDIVEQPAPGGSAPAPEAPKKTGLMEALKDMLMKPKIEEIAHIAPEPLTTRVAAPLRPTLTEKLMPKSIAKVFQPKSSAEDIAMASMPNPIQTGMKTPTLPMPSGPTLTTKAFSGIKAKDLPFQVGADEAITGGGAVIPIAVGKTSLKQTINYGGAQLQESKGKPVLQSKTGFMSAGSAEMNSLGAGAASSIQLSGTGGTGNAPTGAPSGSVLTNRAGSSGGFGRGGFGSGTGRGSGLGSGSGLGGGIPSAAAQLEQELEASNASGKSSKRAGGSGPEIVGPLKNRPVVKKVIPQYPAWAEEQGIIGSVRLYFTVTADGVVRTNMRITKTTGYPQLDELAIEALKQWRFAPIGGVGDEGQWGIITFNFALSS
ncbi:MAG: energy transducer TonB [Elusimicrobiota bacterium]